MILFEAIAILVGTVIGAGILGIPYAAAQVGFSVALVMLIGLSFMNMLLQLMFAEVTLRTRTDHEIPGFSGLYLGNSAKGFAMIISILSGFGTLLAYLIAQGDILHALIGIDPFVGSLLFVVVGGYVVYRGLASVRIFELIVTVGIILVMFLIGYTSIPHLDLSQLYYVHFDKIGIPYGVLIFALSGTVAIPQMHKAMFDHETLLPKAIISANLIVLAIYAVFMFFVLGVTGLQTTQIATIGLGERIGPSMIFLGNILALFTISTSFMTVGLSIRRLFQHDYNFPRIKAWLITMGIPLLFFLLGVHSFILVLGIVGGVLMGTQGILIVFAFWRAIHTGKRKPEYKLGGLPILGTLLIGILGLGAVVTILNIFIH